MALNFIIDTLESVAENVRGLYKAADGKFQLDLSGYEDPVGLKSALSKERDNAKNASKRSAAWEILGKTPEEIQELLAKQRDADDNKLLTEKNFEELSKKRTERMQTDFDKQIKGKDDAIGKLNAKAMKLAAGKVSGALTSAASKTGALPEAMEDIVLRGQFQGWAVNDDGDVVALRDGEPILGKDGKTPLSPSEWVDTLRETAPHLWPRAQGGNAPGSHNSPARNGVDYSKLSPAERITQARLGKH